MKRKHKKPVSPEFAERLIKSLLTVFADAYQSHANGATETELLINHDIFAAAAMDTHPTIKEGHRRAIQSAVHAVDHGVSLPNAQAYLETTLRRKLKELLDEINNN
jgi:hypothetical protein